MIWTINAVAEDGTSWAMYFDCDTREQAEHIVNMLKLNTDDAGVCEMVEICSEDLH